MKLLIKSGIIGAFLGLIYLVLLYIIMIFNLTFLNFLLIPLPYISFPVFLSILKTQSCFGDGCWALLYKPINIIIFFIWFVSIGFIIGVIIGWIIKICVIYKKINKY
jgi:hypothetical protein